MNRYSIIHPAGIRPPDNALDAEAWRDLEPSTKGGTVFIVQNADGNPFDVYAKDHLEQVLRTLIKRPLYCGSRCRHSQYVSKLRELGVEIDTEGYRGDEQTGRDIYGVWFLRSNVSTIQNCEVAA